MLLKTACVVLCQLAAALNLPPPGSGRSAASAFQSQPLALPTFRELSAKCLAATSALRRDVLPLAGEKEQKPHADAVHLFSPLAPAAFLPTALQCRLR